MASNPGDIGLPTTVDVIGVEKTSDHWSEYLTFSDDMFTQYGYKNFAQYTLYTKEEPKKYSAKINWLACKGDECVPQETTLYYNMQKTVESFTVILLFAFVGGLILNFMPCIFPILSLKAISLIQSSQKEANIRAESLLYFCGVLLSFICMATILIFLKNQGEAVGWGFQLQSPIFITILILVFSIIFFMLLDVINLRNPFANRVGRISFNKAKLDSFITGFFAVVIASPCTAPFMGIAIGYAINQDVYLYYPIFISLAIGYALPFTLIGFFPKTLHKIMPKSGKWMVILKKIFAIPVFLTIVWLCWVLSFQLQVDAPQELMWKQYNKEEIKQDIKNKKEVLINFGAKWCITCLANEKIAFNSAEFRKFAKENNFSLYKADWTNKNEDIAKELGKYGRNSVPLYVYYKKDKMKILPQLLSPSILLNNLK